MAVLGTAALVWGQTAGKDTLRVKTNAAAVQVFLDGRDSGQTPLTLEGLSVGPHTLTLVKSGYEDLVQEVQIVAGKPNSVFLVMKKRAEPQPSLPVRYRVLHAHSGGGGCVGSLEVTEVGITFQDEKGKDTFQLTWPSIWIVSRHLFGEGLSAVGYDIRWVDWKIYTPDWANPRVVPWVRVEAGRRGYTFFAVPSEAGANPAPSPSVMSATLFDVLSRVWEAKRAPAR